MLLIDENTQCLGNCKDYLHVTKDNLESIYLQAYNRSSVANKQDIRIPTNISKHAARLAYVLATQGRSVYVVAKDEDCTLAVNNLQNTDYVVIDGKLFLNDSDGSPQC